MVSGRCFFSYRIWQLSISRGSLLKMGCNWPHSFAYQLTAGQTGAEPHSGLTGEAACRWMDGWLRIIQSIDAELLIYIYSWADIPPWSSMYFLSDPIISIHLTDESTLAIHHYGWFCNRQPHCWSPSGQSQHVPVLNELLKKEWENVIRAPQSSQSCRLMPSCSLWARIGTEMGVGFVPKIWRYQQLQPTMTLRSALWCLWDYMKWHETFW